MSRYAVSLATRSHKGLVRGNNQDWLQVGPDLGVVARRRHGWSCRAGRVLAASREVEAALADLLLPSQRRAELDDAETCCGWGMRSRVAEPLLVDESTERRLRGMGTTMGGDVHRESRIYMPTTRGGRLYGCATVVSGA